MKYVIIGRIDSGAEELANSLSDFCFYQPKRTDTPTDIETDLEVCYGNITQYISEKELEKSHAILLDPDALIPLADKYPDESFHVLHITNSVENPTPLTEQQKNIAKAEDRRYTQFETYVREDQTIFANNMTIYWHVEYDFTEQQKERFAEYFAGAHTRYERICHIVSECIEHGLAMEPDENFNREILADQILMDNDLFCEIMKAYLTLPEIYIN